MYRDQGLEVLSKWLNTLFQSRVEAAYQNLRKLHLLPPVIPAPPQPVAPTARYPSPDAGPALLSRLAGHLVATHPEGIDRPNRRRRRSSNPREDGGANAGKQEDVRVDRGCHVDSIRFFTSSCGTPWFSIRRGNVIAASRVARGLGHGQGRKRKKAGEVEWAGRI